MCGSGSLLVSVESVSVVWYLACGVTNSAFFKVYLQVVSYDEMVCFGLFFYYTYELQQL